MLEDDKETETEDTLVEETLPEDESGEEEEPKIKPQKTYSLVKRDISFLQKKLAELEIAISEVQENVQKIDLSDLESLKQRVEDVEDLTMVENAGVVELKKMLEDIQSSLSAIQEIQEKVSNLEQIVSLPLELAEVESKINETVKTETANLLTKDEFQNKLNEVSSAISDLSAELTRLSMSIPDLEKKLEEINLENLKEDVKNYITPMIPGFPSFDTVTRSLEESIASIKQDVESYRGQLEKIKFYVEGKVNEPLQIELLKKLEDVRDNLVINSTKVEAIDSFAQELAQQVNNFAEKINEITPIIQKLDKISVEKLKEDIKNYIVPLIPEAPDLSVIKRDFEDSVTESRHAIELIKKDFERLKQDVEEKIKAPLHTKLLKELEDIKSESLVTGSKFVAVDSFTKELAREISEVRPLINRLTSKIESFDGMDEVEKSIDEKLHEFRALLSTAETIKQSNQPLKELDQVLTRVRDVENTLSEIQSSVKDFKTSKETSKWKIGTDRELEKFKKDLEATISKKVDENLYEITLYRKEFLSSFGKKLEAIDKLVETVENDLSVLQGNVMVLENRTSETTTTNIVWLVDKVESLENTIESIESGHVEKINQTVTKLNELENRVYPQTIDDELISRLAFLESRITALENILTTKSYPIVIE